MMDRDTKDAGIAGHARWIVIGIGRNRGAGSVRLRIEPSGEAASPNLSFEIITTMNR
ncbi:hypothetical protein N2601_33790 (plasmid) [Rhizobium sp. CB3060]|uniref:hypothetical protein n=1 Tax=Rhizobium sp. CB3060 TaxID=3138255 RepID=UPI0021A695A0|nr:hypothetical protein [Rhizobium tropici]UWU26214.1 hypothetical protein N2601_33790 [Rhizobium tropici]